MNIRRFIGKCLTDPPAAARSGKLVARSIYGRFYWSLYPSRSLPYRLPTGSTLFLQPLHSFTHCFWPDVDGYEPDVRETLKYLIKSGDIFIDCGANVGYFSMLAGDLIGKDGKVISIEANPVTYKLLKHNLDYNNLGIPLHYALAPESGDVELFVPQSGDIYSSLRKGGLVNGDSVTGFSVQGRKLDDIVNELALPRVDLVKIDIEGAELGVLQSAHQLLSKFRPIMIMEYGTNTWPIFGASSSELKMLMNKYGYYINLYDLTQKKMVAVTEEVWQKPYANLILVPKEKLKG